MELEGDSSRKSACARKRTRKKRSYTRKAALNTTNFINMAEARREIVNALHLHRSSSSSASVKENPTILNMSQLTDSMPIPEPTWSTTAPAVLCAPPPAAMEVDLDHVEYYWFDNEFSSSYTWWLGFLKSLDGEKGAINEPGWLMPCLDVEKSAAAIDNDQNQNQTPFTDEWVIFPAAEEQV